MTLQRTFTFALPSLEKTAEGYSRVTLPGLRTLTEPGYPALPFRQVRLALPTSGARDVGDALPSVEVEPGETITIPLDGELEPAKEQVPISMAADVLATSSPGLPPLWPREWFSMQAQQYWHGYRVLFLRLYPCRRVAEAGPTLLCTSVLTVRVRVAVLQDAPTKLLRATWAAEAVARLVDNPEDVSNLEPYLPEPETELPRLSGDTDETTLLILTSREWCSAFLPLAERRRAQGIPTTIQAVEDIWAHCDWPEDRAICLRAFIRDVYRARRDSPNPLRYVLLGGDAELIPAVPMHVVAGIYETGRDVSLVSDAYYAGLDDGNGATPWDADGDGLYGEGDVAAGGTGDAGEEADLLPEVWVGRVPVNTDLEARQWVSKVLSYEDSAARAESFFHHALWLGEKLDEATYGGAAKELVLPLLPDLEVRRLYDQVGRWDASVVLSALGEAHLVNHLGHANSSTVLRLQIADVERLDNELPFIVYSQGCLAAAFAKEDGEAIAERFLTAPHGAVAFLGNTSYGWYLPKNTNGASQLYDYEFFDALFQEDIPRLGLALEDAKLDLLDQVGAVGPERWVWLELALLGDPSMAVVTRYNQPRARISSPTCWAELAGTVEIQGEVGPGAAEGASLQEYQLHWGEGASPMNWHILGEGQTARAGVLATWETASLSDGEYRLRLVAKMASSSPIGATTVDELPVQIRHARLLAPPDGS
ncbi:MAG: hypothetical protein H5T69_07200, partial [Chloroflexi bacterium]|nr:hypothetical protein [Chloroflexota bacterium]